MAKRAIVSVKTPDTVFASTPESQSFKSLSVRDLIDARDLFHYHLMNKDNVVGTAVGLYLVRQNRDDKTEKRFDNTKIMDWSWPCVLVLVRDWVDFKNFHGKKKGTTPEKMIPSRIYLPDGRVVPICVVKVTQAEPNGIGVPPWQWPENLLGGGLPVGVEVQGQTRIATIGGLVSDGHTVYALSNRHVCGRPGERVFSIVHGRRFEIGTVSDKQLTNRPFSIVYPDFKARRTLSNLDIGLIELDDLGDWTSQTFGIGAVGPLADVYEKNLSLRLIDARVIAHGAVSGKLEGNIKALFYRYKTVGGTEYVSDFLISPRELDGTQSRRGDSGAIWHLEGNGEGELPRPLAIEWGGQVLVSDEASARLTMVLATSLSNVCRLLDVELVRDHNTGVLPYWGQTGHYSIASYACKTLGNDGLGKLMKANVDLVSFRISELDPKEISKTLTDAKKFEKFVPLADVPDMIWKNLAVKITGGRDTQYIGSGRSTGPEHPTHFADIDEPRPSDGKTLRQLSLADPQNNLTVAFWQSFYDECGHNKSTERGLLPFRIWQFYDAMVDAVAAADLDRFVSAAGIMAHYVGDACQPLHGSRFADGYKDKPVTVEVHHRDGTVTEEESYEGKGVHSAYESNMIDRFSPKLIDWINIKVGQINPYPNVTSGFGAALATVKLMDRSANEIPPEDLVDTYINSGGKKIVAVYEALWVEFGDSTSKIMADGARVLAMLWKSAWAAGKGSKIAKAKLKQLDTDDLMALYQDESFVPSLDLDHIQPVLK